MASRAVTKSAIDWTAFGRKLGSAGKENFRHIKGTYDQALARYTVVTSTKMSQSLGVIKVCRLMF